MACYVSHNRVTSGADEVVNAGHVTTEKASRAALRSLTWLDYIGTISLMSLRGSIRDDYTLCAVKVSSLIVVLIRRYGINKFYVLSVFLSFLFM